MHLDSIFEDKFDTHDITIISGNASGADALGERYAREHSLKLEIYPAEWEEYGKSAGPLRNKLMAEKADFVVAFWDGNSRGTKNMIDCAIDQNIPYRIIKV